MAVVVRAARAVLLLAAMTAISRVGADADTVLLHADMMHLLVEGFIGCVRIRSLALLSAAAGVLSMMYPVTADICMLI